MSDCIFCKIVAGTAPAKIYYQDEQVTAFQDLNAHPPVHILIVPNHHLDSMNEASPQDEAVLGHMLLIAKKLAAEKQIEQKGYRLIINTGRGAGQSVFHVHLHLMGGQPMGSFWPMA